MRRPLHPSRLVIPSEARTFLFACSAQRHLDHRPLIPHPRPMLLPAQLARCRRLRIIHLMLHWLQRLHVRKHCLQIVIGQILVNHHRHDRAQRPCLHRPRPHHLQKQRFVVIRNPRCILGQIRARHKSPRARKLLPTWSTASVQLSRCWLQSHRSA